MHRLVVALLTAWVVAAPLSPGTGAPRVAWAEDENPFECPIRALLFEADEGLRRTYDHGIRKGLEQAQLPRVCRELGLDEARRGEILQRLEAAPPPLLFVLGRRTAGWLGDRLADVPRVYIDFTWVAGGLPELPEPAVLPPAAVVRAILPAGRLRALLQDLGLRGDPRPAVLLSWPTETPDQRERARRLGEAAGFRPAWEGSGLEPVMLLHVRLDPEAELPPFAEVFAKAEARQLPLLSDDLDHWGRGASVVLSPDPTLVGRVAAEEGRRLLERQDLSGLLRRDVDVFELRIDLEAARRQGFDPPLRLLARADLLRRGPLRDAAR